jgi:hypothetical protein
MKMGQFPKRLVRGGHEWLFVRTARDKKDVKDVVDYQRHYHHMVVTTLKIRGGLYGVYSRPSRRK